MTHVLSVINSLQALGRDSKHHRQPAMTINNITALRYAVESGIAIAILPDYIVDPAKALVRILPQAEMPELDCYLVYAEEVKGVARVEAFRDFLVSNAQRWNY